MSWGTIVRHFEFTQIGSGVSRFGQRKVPVSIVRRHDAFKPPAGWWPEPESDHVKLAEWQELGPAEPLDSTAPECPAGLGQRRSRRPRPQVTLGRDGRRQPIPAKTGGFEMYGLALSCRRPLPCRRGQVTIYNPNGPCPFCGRSQR